MAIKITEKQLEQAIKTHNPYLLPVCCIIKSTLTNLIDGNKKTVWQIITEPKENCCLEIYKKKAEAVISLLNLQPAIQTQNDILYDTSDFAYRTKYRFHNVTC